MRFSILFCLLLISPSILGQAFAELSGTVSNTDKQPLVGATVLLLNLPDSTMEEFCVVNEKGVFRMNVAKKENYLLQVSFMGYESYTHSFSLATKTNLGTIILEEAPQTIATAEITEERIPMKVKGDTLEYHADAFRPQEHDMVEDLLRKLPGIEVEKDGTIKAQGKKVDRILIDGKTFFGDNPEIATKNLPADAVNKVQVYDRLSEMAELSGVDDGQRHKTINLKLKEGKKHGFFGNIGGGYGYPNHRYKGNLSLNYFNPQLRVSTIGAINNINEQSFNFNDYLDLMGGIRALMSGSGNVAIEINDDDPIASLLMGSKEGLSQTIGGGLNFNWFANEKTAVSTHYFYSILDKQKQLDNHSKSISSDGFFSQNSLAANQIQAGNHNINSTLQHQLDKTQELRLRLNWKFNNSLLRRLTNEQRYENGLTLQNSLAQDYDNRQKGWGVNTNLIYRKKLAKDGRVILASFTGGYSRKDAFANNLSNTFLFNNQGHLIATDSLVQEQNNLEHQQVYLITTSFIEPIKSKSFLECKIEAGLHLDNKDKEVLDITESAAFLNANLSNLTQKQYHFQTLTTRFQTNLNSLKLTVAAALQRSFLKGIFSNNLPQVSRSYYYPLGSFSLQAELNKQSHFNFQYQSSISEPKVEQLQPILDNSNPLVLVLGNPSLTPEYNHELSLRYNLFDQFSFTSLFATVRFTFVQQKIVQTQTIDANFRTTYQARNTALGYQGNAYLSFERPIKPLGIKFRIGINGQIDFAETWVNEIANNQLTQQYTFKASIENRKKKIIDAAIGGKIILNNSTFSINTTLNTTYLNYLAFADLKINIAKKWQVFSDFEYQIYADPAFESDIFVPFWSAGISRTFLDGDKLKIAFQVFNILDQQLTINRFSYNETISESKINTLGRYFMLSVQYKLVQVGKKEK